MICHAVIYNNKLATLPLIGASISMHKRLKTLYKLSGYLSTITEPHSLAVAVPLIYPTRISSKHLVVEGVTPVCAHTDGRKYLRADFAII